MACDEMAEKGLRVSANVPTKRELKDKAWQGCSVGCQSFSKCPYEEGTEREVYQVSH